MEGDAATRCAESDEGVATLCSLFHGELLKAMGTAPGMAGVRTRAPAGDPTGDELERIAQGESEHEFSLSFLSVGTCSMLS